MTGVPQVSLEQLSDRKLNFEFYLRTETESFTSWETFHLFFTARKETRAEKRPHHVRQCSGENPGGPQPGLGLCGRGPLPVPQPVLLRQVEAVCAAHEHSSPGQLVAAGRLSVQQERQLGHGEHAAGGRGGDPVQVPLPARAGGVPVERAGAAGSRASCGRLGRVVHRGGCPPAVRSAPEGAGADLPGGAAAERAPQAVHAPGGAERGEARAELGSGRQVRLLRGEGRVPALHELRGRGAPAEQVRALRTDPVRGPLLQVDGGNARVGARA